MAHADFTASIAPKVQGTYNLHRHLPLNLDFFTMLSSIASITGSRGQANYAVGNAYQDALARHRMALGQKAISLNIGPVLAIGIAAENDLTEALAADGFEALDKDELFALLDWACNPDLPIPIDPAQHQIITGLGGAAKRKAADGVEVYWMRKRLFSILRNAANPSNTLSSRASSDQGRPDIGTMLVKSSDPVERQEIVVQALVQKLTRVLNIPTEDVEPEKPIHAFGVDSLVALEVRYWFLKEMKANISVFDIMGSASLRILAEIVEGKSEYVAVTARPEVK